MSEALQQLRLGLRGFSLRFAALDVEADLTAMTVVLHQVRRDHGGAAMVVASKTIMAAVREFRRTRAFNGFRDLKYVCLGLGMADDDGWCVFADARLRAKVTGEAERQAEPRRRIRCFQALLSSYLSFRRGASVAADQGWQDLRRWLQLERERIRNLAGNKPAWLGALAKHVALLGDRPCEAFGAALLRGDASGLNDAVESLAIPRNSWVLEDSVIAHMRAGCELPDDAFKRALPSLLSAGGGGKIDFGETLRIRCVAMLVTRYAKCQERAEDFPLRDAAVSAIGNPWLKRTSWDAWVKDADGNPDEQSREMINGWLKRRLISDFFELLSAERTGDRRRLDYWLGFESRIEDMWFALGRDAQNAKGAHFTDFRTRARGRLLFLEETTTNNNAFVMRIGSYLVVEFGVTGNAAFVYRWDSLNPHLRNILTSTATLTSIDIDLLKSLGRFRSTKPLEKLRHSGPWEQTFDACLKSILDPRPFNTQQSTEAAPHIRDDHPTPRAWEQFVRTHGLTVDDHRPRQGALWVRGVKHPARVIVQLRAWGFRVREPRGWFKE